jgi:uncharacterized protein (TIGR03000 family)
MPVYGGSYYSSSEGNTYPQAAEGMAPATLVVHLPASARLTVDDTPTRSISETRQFITPPLDRDKQFHYELKAEMNRDGRPVTVTKRVAVRGGETTDVRLDMPERTTSRR